MKNNNSDLEASINEFFNSAVDPAFKEIQTRLELSGKKVDIDKIKKECWAIKVSSDDEDPFFSYTIYIEDYRQKEDMTKINPVPKVIRRIGNRKDNEHFIKPTDYPISDFTKTDIINDFKKLFPFQLRKINF